MQTPTCKNVRIRSIQDVHKIFAAVQRGWLKMITRRLDADERMALRSGCIYVWEERGPNTEVTGLGMERFTEGRRWSPSRVRDVSATGPPTSDMRTELLLQDFLFYFEQYSGGDGRSVFFVLLRARWLTASSQRQPDTPRMGSAHQADVLCARPD